MNFVPGFFPTLRFPIVVDGRLSASSQFRVKLPRTPIVPLAMIPFSLCIGIGASPYEILVIGGATITSNFFYVPLDISSLS